VLNEKFTRVRQYEYARSINLKTAKMKTSSANQLVSWLGQTDVSPQLQCCFPRNVQVSEIRAQH
jgi:hypothetical protein